jgi:hypothetical protein
VAVAFLVPVLTLALALVLALLHPSPALALEGSSALLQGLDKVTARISSITAPMNEAVRFGTLEIIVHRCYKRPPEETPESAALLEIHDVKPGENRALLFKGWMFASSPALSALEHPVYDVWVKDCLNSSSSEANGPR